VVLHQPLRHVRHRIEQHDRPTGPLRLASRELTAIDLVEHANTCGGISHVAATLDALGPFRIPRLVAVAETRDISTTRRLGWLPSHLNPGLDLLELQELADFRRPTPTDLAPGAPRRGHIDLYWNVRANIEIRP
jgi:predicted transcriptional regulator of viral defense system